MVIYKITNLVNGKIYIGQTTNKHPEYRFSGHKADAKYRPTLPIHKAIKKYGESSFSFEVIKQCNDLNHLDKMEQFYIKHFNSLVPNGYNVDPGGCRRELLLGYAKKRVFSSEHRRKLFESACRRKHTQESKVY
jgi:group I intron endonuclease